MAAGRRDTKEHFRFFHSLSKLYLNFLPYQFFYCSIDDVRNLPLSLYKFFIFLLSKENIKSKVFASLYPHAFLPKMLDFF